MSFLNEALNAFKQLALVEHRLNELSEETKRQAHEQRLLDRRVTRLEATAGTQTPAPPINLLTDLTDETDT